MSPKISVIVPVYRAEAFLGKCVNSVLQQTERDFELLLVDDGSPDNSGALCDGYAQTDARIRVIHQKNAGVSAARNAGIAAAGGQYIGFVDADDWIEPTMLARLWQVAEETHSDVVMCDTTTVYSGGKTETDTILCMPKSTVLKKTDFSAKVLLEMAGSACRCLYRNNAYGERRYPLSFPLGIKFSEDRIFNLYAFGQANQVAYIKESYYNRYMNDESAVHRFHADYFEACKLAAAEIQKAIADVWDDDATLQRAYLGQLVGGAYSAICNYYYKTSPLSFSERRRAVKELCRDEQLQEALSRLDSLGRKDRWLKEQKSAYLIAYAILANKKHRR